MKRVRILEPFDGFAIGDTPEFFGHVARAYIAEGRAEAIDPPPADKSSRAAKKPLRKRAK